MIEYVFHLPTGMGKTQMLIEQVKRFDGILVVMSEELAIQVRKNGDLRPDQVITWRKVRDISKSSMKPIFIDNADYLLEMCLSIRRGSIMGVSIDRTYDNFLIEKRKKK